MMRASADGFRTFRSADKPFEHLYQEGQHAQAEHDREQDADNHHWQQVEADAEARPFRYQGQGDLLSLQEDVNIIRLSDQTTAVSVAFPSRENNVSS